MTVSKEFLHSLMADIFILKISFFALQETASSGASVLKYGRRAEEEDDRPLDVAEPHCQTHPCKQQVPAGMQVYAERIRVAPRSDRP